MEMNLADIEDIDEIQGYKVQVGKTYRILRSEYQGRTFYKAEFTKKNKDGSTLTAYKNIMFMSKTLDNNIPDKSLVMPKNLYEDFYYAKSDKFHYNAIWFVVVTDYEIKEDEVSLKEEALMEYNQELQNFGEDLPF